MKSCLAQTSLSVESSCPAFRATFFTTAAFMFGGCCVGSVTDILFPRKVFIGGLNVIEVRDRDTWSFIASIATAGGAGSTRNVIADNHRVFCTYTNRVHVVNGDTNAYVGVVNDGVGSIYSPTVNHSGNDVILCGHSAAGQTQVVAINTTTLAQSTAIVIHPTGADSIRGIAVSNTNNRVYAGVSVAGGPPSVSQIRVYSSAYALLATVPFPINGVVQELIWIPSTNRIFAFFQAQGTSAISIQVFDCATDTFVNSVSLPETTVGLAPAYCPANDLVGAKAGSNLYFIGGESEEIACSLSASTSTGQTGVDDLGRWFIPQNGGTSSVDSYGI